MKYSMCADIMFVAPGEHGLIWPDAQGIGKAMELAKENGLDAIEFFDFAGRDLKAIAAKSKETGVAIAAICQKDGKFWGCPDKIDTFVQGFKDSIDAARELGVTNLIISDDLYPTQLPREEVHAAMVKGLKELAPLAEEAGLTILAEPLSGKYFQGAKEAFDILKEVGSKNILLLYDCFHFQLIEGNITNTIKENIDWIGHIHGAGAPARCELTDGELDYGFVLKTIRETGYDRYFGLEFFTFTDREEKVRKSAALLKEA